MTLRELMIERILFAVDEDELRDRYMMERDLEDELKAMSDLDFLELYESVMNLTGEM